MPRTKTQELRLTPRQVGELFTPARLEIYESFQQAGPGTIADLARRLGRAADSLYYHVKRLLEIGVIEELDVEVAVAPKRGRHGATFGVVAETVTMTLEPDRKDSREAWCKGASAVLRLADRNVRAAVESRAVRTEGPERDLFVTRSKVRMTRAQLIEFNRHVNALQALLHGHMENDRGRRYTVNLMMAPLETQEA